jgi:hypothetical protein
MLSFRRYGGLGAYQADRRLANHPLDDPIDLADFGALRFGCQMPHFCEFLRAQLRVQEPAGLNCAPQYGYAFDRFLPYVTGGVSIGDKTQGTSPSAGLNENIFRMGLNYRLEPMTGN